MLSLWIRQDTCTTKPMDQKSLIKFTGFVVIEKSLNVLAELLLKDSTLLIRLLSTIMLQLKKRLDVKLKILYDFFCENAVVK